MRVSPLLASAGVLLGFGVLAVPMIRLTSESERREGMFVEDAGVAEGEEGKHPAFLRVRLLDAVQDFRVVTGMGDVLWAAESLDAGEWEEECLLAEGFLAGAGELIVSARVAESVGDTALFLTVVPDAYEERTAWMLGAGELMDVMAFEWEDHARE